MVADIDTEDMAARRLLEPIAATVRRKAGVESERARPEVPMGEDNEKADTEAERHAATNTPVLIIARFCLYDEEWPRGHSSRPSLSRDLLGAQPKAQPKALIRPKSMNE